MFCMGACGPVPLSGETASPSEMVKAKGGEAFLHS